MLYLLWALLNIVLCVFFLVVCVKATILTRREIGLGAAIVFVFGLLSFTGNSDTNRENVEPGTNQIKTWKFMPIDSVAIGSIASINIDLEKTWVSKYTLSIQYGKDKQLKYIIPVSANTSVTGLESGTSWKPVFININGTDENSKFTYEVVGTVTWRLLGMTVYSQSKNWKGVVLLK